MSMHMYIDYDYSIDHDAGVRIVRVVGLEWLYYKLLCQIVTLNVSKLHINPTFDMQLE